MAEISATAVKTLREKTGAGMMECKKALTEAEGDETKAIEILRKRGMAGAEKKAGRVAAEGAVGSYIHMGGKVGVLVEVNCETDFVARGEEFQSFVKDLAMHIAAMDPRYVSKEEVAADDIAKEREIELERLKADEKNAKKPADVLDKIVEGRLGKFYEAAVLLEQPFVKDQTKTVGDLVKELTAKIGEKIAVRRFTRYKMGEGHERKSGDFASEVSEMVNKD
jgi:elongation factor Ts